MSTYQQALRRRLPRERALARGVSVPLWLAVAASRVLVLAAGAAGALTMRRVPGWASVDTTRLTDHLGSVGNVLAAPAVRWDSLAYLGIAAHGYTRVTTAFFPLYPLAIRCLGWLTGSDVIAAVAISTAAFAVALALLHRLTELELGRSAADGAVLLLAFAPVSFFFTAVYTESLFLALSAGAIYAARRDRLALGCALAALAALTHVTGVLLIVPIALLALRSGRRPGPWLAWLALPPAALLALMAYLAGRGYGWLAPLHAQVAHSFDGPQATLLAAARDAWHGVSALGAGVRPYAPSLYGPFSSGFESLLLLAVLAVAVWALVIAFRRLPLAYGAYALLALLVCVASETRVQPLLGLDRYTLVIFPLWMAAGAHLAERRAVWPVALLGACALCFYTFQFATWAFIA